MVWVTRQYIYLSSKASTLTGGRLITQEHVDTAPAKAKQGGERQRPAQSEKQNHKGLRNPSRPGEEEVIWQEQGFLSPGRTFSKQNHWSPTNSKAQDRAQAQKENTAFRRRHCPVFSNEKGGGARSRRLRVTTLPPAAHRNSVVRGPVRHRSVQEVSKETQAGEEKRADPEAQRSTATTRVVPPRSPGHGPSSRCPRNPCNTGREGTPLGGCACVAVLRPDWPVLILRAGAP